MTPASILTSQGSEPLGNTYLGIYVPSKSCLSLTMCLWAFLVLNYVSKMEKCKKKYILNSYYLKNTKNFQTFFWISTTHFNFYFYHLESVCINLDCKIKASYLNKRSFGASSKWRDIFLDQRRSVGAPREWRHILWTKGGQFRPPVNEVTFYGPKKVSWGALWTTSHFFGTKEVSLGPPWMMSHFLNQGRSVGAPCE